MDLIVIPPDLAGSLHEPLRRHYQDDPSVRVIVERRGAGETPHATKAAGRRRAGDRTHRPARPKMVAASGFGSLPPEAIPYKLQLGFWSEIDYEASGIADAESLRLVALFQEGDEAAFEGLYRLHYPDIYDFLRVLLDSADRAEDATQDVFISAHKALSRYRYQPNVPFFAWLRRLARNRALTILRRRRLDPEPIDPNTLAELGGAEETWLTERDLMALVAQLPSPDQQRALMLRVVGLDVPETASAMGKTANSVKQLVRRARKRLHSEIRGDDAPPELPPQRVSMSRHPGPSRVLTERRAALGAPESPLCCRVAPGCGQGTLRR